MPLTQRQPSPLPRLREDGVPFASEEDVIRGPSPAYLSPLPKSPNGSSLVTTRDKTPVPYSKLAPLLVQRWSEGLTYAIVFPYINQMILDMGVEEKSVGVWSAIAESAMMVTEAISAPFYGALADKVGRRPVLIVLQSLFGLFGVAFGLSRTVWMAILLRSSLGLLAGCGVISRTMVGELCDKSNRIQGFAIFSPSVIFGMTTAPLLGGFLAKPSGRILPASWTLFTDYPYLLPALFTGGSAAISAILCIFLLPETLQRAKRDAQPRDIEKSTNGGMQGLLKHEQFQNVLFLYGMNNAVMFAWEAIYPLFGFTNKNLGGLGLSTQTLGVVLGLSAGLSILMTIFVFPLLHGSLSESVCLRICLLSYPAAVLFFPVLWAMSFPSEGDNLPSSVWVVMTIQMVLRRTGDFATTQLDTLVLDYIPGPEYLASANALTFSVAAVGRAVGSFIVSWVFSLSTRFSSPYSPGRHLVWLVFVLLCTPSVYLANRLLHGDPMKNETNDQEERYELMNHHEGEARGTSVELHIEEDVRYRIV
ncbi:uncharacterized protein IL334_000773 [Kwoniella shivajii]|uniref:Major facilitator superfamily (MFS) profile domain-containing protein n=1 Tax=Kwoniella shivajii TaxID=564305 RepID=A0ABZ1CQ31_9TREE|nr:hypothetical protein IL334_000773 [Kwoniella shivajii]